MEKKLRIQLFDHDGRMIDDRMVSQDPEISSGPKLKHDGPMRIEFSFDSKDDIEKAKTYLDQLVGNIPLGPKKARKKLIKDLADPSSREDLLNEAIRISENQDQLIAFLRENGFKFLTTDFLETFNFQQLELKDRHKEKYQWMVLCKRVAKNPKADKYDPMLIFGIQLLPEHNEKVVVYLHGQYYKTYKVAVPEKPKEVFKKTKMVIFPEYMTHEERDKFRLELRQYQDNPERKLSKFFTRWMKWVENLPEISQLKKVGDSE